MKLSNSAIASLAIIYCFTQFQTRGHAASEPSTCPYNFEAASIQSENVKATLGNSVLRLTDPVSGLLLGTGFLIDSYNGLLITADHVVENTGSTCGTGRPAVVISNDRVQNFIGCYVQGLGTDRGIDLALVQIDASTQWPATEQIDVSFRYPRDDENVRILGYPVMDSYLDSQPGTVRRTLRATKKFQDQYGNYKSVNHALIIIKHDIWNGHSGSPAISLKDGMAFGVAMALGESNVGYYVPLGLSSALFALETDSFRPSVVSKDLMILLQDHHEPGRKARLAQLLTGKVRNFDMLMLMNEVVARRKYGESFVLADIMYCPLAKFFAERGLLEAFPFIRLSSGAGGTAVPVPLVSDPAQ